MRILDPSSGTDQTGDVLISGGRTMFPGGDETGGIDAVEIEGGGKWLFPGLVDMHAHLREPGDERSETVETGLRAAIAGGITTVGVMPNTTPPMDSLESVISLMEKAYGCGLSRVVPVPSVTVGRMGMMPVDFEEFHHLGISAFSDDGSPVADSSVMMYALEAVSRFDGVIIEHPEVRELATGNINRGRISCELGDPGIPHLAETADVARCLEIARSAGGRLHLTHLSLPRSVSMARDDCFDPVRVTVDVTPHHLALDEDALLEHGSMAKMNPPLREQSQRLELARLVKEGLVDAIASDHAPHSPGKKRGKLSETAFGITGLETLLPVTLQVLGELGMAPLDILNLLTMGPAGVLGARPPEISHGSMAECVLFDPEMEYSLDGIGTFSRSSNTPFLKTMLKGRVLAVWMERLLYMEGEFV